MMALALEGKVSDFRDLLDEYNRIAKARNTGEGSIFEAAPTKEELVKEFLNFKKCQGMGWCLPLQPQGQRGARPFLCP